MKKSSSLSHSFVIFRLLLVISLLFTFSKTQKAESHHETDNTKTDTTASQEQVSPTGDKRLSKIYTFNAKALDGSEIDFKRYEGDVLLIVNTASKCGFTSQYAALEDLNKKYSARGLKILGFPCNQFGGQEPGDNTQIASFCHKNYGVDFQMFDKIDVNGGNAHPLYKYLTETAPGVMGSKAIKWNFTKFLIDRQGQIVERYAPNVKPEDIASAIEKLL